MPCSYSYLQVKIYNIFYGAVSITVVLRETDNKVEGSNPSKTFFYFFLFLLFFIIFFFFFFAFANMQEIFRDLRVCRKSMFVVLCTCKTTSLGKMGIQRRCKSYY